MRKIRRYFLTGLAVILPIILTIYIIVAIFRFADRFLGGFLNRYLERILGFYVPGLGLIVSLIIVFIVGFLATVLLGRRVFGLFERIFLKFPLVHQIYPSVKQIVNFIFSKERHGFKKVVLIEYPRKGIYSIGFVTAKGKGEIQGKIPQGVLSLLVPTTPNPTSGVYLLVPEDEAIALDMSVEEGLKVVISGGTIMPPSKNKT